ncbi:MAG: DUF1080 domain-containing protein [Pirellulaceae bacterium]|nr:DUF1080 domain-containing protein [Pirellulaceae bacterium]
MKSAVRFGCFFAATLSCIALRADEGETISLFNNKDLGGWSYHLADPNVKMTDVWTVEDGVLTCAGKPAGYLITERRDFSDYRLTLDWRWHTEKGGNNGVLVHCSTPGALGVWCKSIEVQLANGNAGDFWIIGTELNVTDEQERKSGRRYRNLTDDSEKPIGQWNTMEIVCQGNEIVVKVNGVLVNHATNVSENRGAIALQSEGTPIQFRNIKLAPLK